MKKIISLNSDWIFCKEGVKENVNLPHTWNNLDVRARKAPTTRALAPTQKFFRNMTVRFSSN